MGGRRAGWAGALVAAGFLINSTPAVAQPDPLFGAPSAEAPEVLVDVGYLIGEWRVLSFSRDESGEFVEAPDTTSYRARYLYDGLGILAEFYGPSPDGFYGVHVITHDSARGLVHSYFNARANRRLEFEGSFGDAGYDLTRRGGYGGGDFLYRETDSEITADSFVKRVYQSVDDGESWVEGDYYFRFERTR